MSDEIAQLRQRIALLENCLRKAEEHFGGPEVKLASNDPDFAILEAIRAALRGGPSDPGSGRVAELEAALRPFAEWSDKLEPGFADHGDEIIAGGLRDAFVTFGDLRRARAVLQGPTDPHEEGPRENVPYEAVRGILGSPVPDADMAARMHGRLHQILQGKEGGPSGAERVDARIEQAARSLHTLYGCRDPRHMDAPVKAILRTLVAGALDPSEGGPSQ